MKTKSISLKLLIILFSSALTTTVVMGQTTYTWTGGDGTGTVIGAATNWGGTLPSTANGDTGQWDGVVPGNLFLTYNGGFQSGFGQSAITFGLTPNQTGSVNINSPVGPSANLAILDLANNSANASFSLGNGGANVLNVIWRPGKDDQVHNLVNNSASANIIYPNVRFQSGGGAVHVLSFGGAGDWRITNNLVGFAAGTLIQKQGAGTLYWNGPSLNTALGTSSIGSPVTIGGGSLVLQNNTVLSTGGFGTTGSQNIINNGTLLKYDAPSLAMTLSGVISGSGALEVANGMLFLTGTNTYTGNTLVSGGTLGGTGVLSGPVTLNPGATLAPGASAGSVGNFTINSNLFIGGNVAMKVNKSLSPSNDVVVVSGALTNTGSGTLTVVNLGPALAVGDKFTLFSQPVQNGGALTITGVGATWKNDLAVDGSITVLTAANPNPPVMEFSMSGNVLSLAWPTNLGWTLQTNSVGLAASNQWFPYPGSAGVTNLNININPKKSNLFFRLVP